MTLSRPNDGSEDTFTGRGRGPKKGQQCMGARPVLTGQTQEAGKSASSISASQEASWLRARYRLVLQATTTRLLPAS